MIFKQCIRLMILTMIVGFGSSQAVTYNYTGPNFTNVNGSYTTSNNITGTFEIPNALTANMGYTDISGLVTSYQFTDGLQTLTQNNSYPVRFHVATDATGLPNQWTISLYENQVTRGNIVNIVETFYEQGTLAQDLGWQDANCTENLGPNGQCSGANSLGTNSGVYFVVAPTNSVSNWSGGVPRIIPTLSIFSLSLMVLFLGLVGFLFIRKQKVSL